MPPPPVESRGYLPRLPAEAYRGRAVVFWTHTIKNRARGWLDRDFHHVFRELSLHVAVREQLLCPVYTLMPDHLHLIWMGVNASSDQRPACTFLRRWLEPTLGFFGFQHQAYDHVFREQERKQSAFMATCRYIAENPVRAGLVPSAGLWPYTGCLVPGFPELHPLRPDFWQIFWQIYEAAVARGNLVLL